MARKTLWDRMVETDRVLYMAYHRAEKEFIEEQSKKPRPKCGLIGLMYDISLVPRFPAPQDTGKEEC